MTTGVILFLIMVCILWLLYLTISLLRLITHYNRLLKTGDARSLSTVLDSLINDVALNKKNIEKVKIHCDTIEKQGQLHIQKVGLVRFNPFNDTGGDQSFIIVLVDGKDTGIIISSLYSRAGTRWYSKKIVNGKAMEHELSSEEKRALKEAKGIKEVTE